MPFWMLVRLGLLGSHSGYMNVATGGDGLGEGSGGGTPNPKDSDPKPKDVNPNPGESDDLKTKSVDELINEIKDLKDQKSTLLKETMSRKELLKQYGDITPQQAKELRDAQRKAQQEAEKAKHERELAAQKELESRGEFEAVKKQIVEQHKQETKSLQDTIKTLQAQVASLQGSIVEKSIGENFANSQFIKNEVLLTPNKAKAIYGSYFEINEDGKVVGYDKPKGVANRSPLVNSDGEPLGFEDAINKIISADPEVDSLLRSKVKIGSGSDSKPKPNVQGDQKSLSPLEKIAGGLAK